MVHTTYTKIVYEIQRFDKDVVGYLTHESFERATEAEAIAYYKERVPQICSKEDDTPVRLQLCYYTDVKRTILSGGV